MSKDDHKIDADDRTVFDVLNERKYTVDYFQREFSWEQKHIEQLVTDLTSTFLDVYAEVEHIWADKFDEHRDEFEQQHEFQSYRNRIGDLVLLPQGTNQSYGAMSYAQKIEHYLKENLFVKSLHPKSCENNPNFLGMAKALGLKFKPHKSFNKTDIDERQALIQSICEVIWDGAGKS
ncbi:MAG: hypothetical protein QOJ40_776 [Verrucomicrobiota bacterium]